MSKKNREGRKIRVKWRKLETNTWKLYHRKLSSGQFKRAKECEYKNTNKMGGKSRNQQRNQASDSKVLPQRVNNLAKINRREPPVFRIFQSLGKNREFRGSCNSQLLARLFAIPYNRVMNS